MSNLAPSQGRPRRPPGAFSLRRRRWVVRARATGAVSRAWRLFAPSSYGPSWHESASPSLRPLRRRSRRAEVSPSSWRLPSRTPWGLLPTWPRCARDVPLGRPLGLARPAAPRRRAPLPLQLPATCSSAGVSPGAASLGGGPARPVARFTGLCAQWSPTGLSPLGATPQVALARTVGGKYTAVRCRRLRTPWVATRAVGWPMFPQLKSEGALQSRRLSGEPRGSSPSPNSCFPLTTRPCVSRTWILR
jgi:hypothetical protein